MEETDNKTLKQSDIQSELKRAVLNSLNTGDAMDSKGIDDNGSESGSIISGKH